MALTPGKRDAQKLYELLDREWENVEEMAMAIMTEAFKAYEAKAKFTVVGQSRREDEDGEFRKVCVGMYSTEKQAQDAALQLVYSHLNPFEPYLAWAIPSFDGTPAAYHKALKVEREKKESAARGATGAERLVALIRSDPKYASSRCKLVVLNEHLEFERCARFCYHPYDCLPLEVAEKEPCEGFVPTTGDSTGLVPCNKYKYHPGPCAAEVEILEGESD